MQTAHERDLALSRTLMISGGMLIFALLLNVVDPLLPRGGTSELAWPLMLGAFVLLAFGAGRGGSAVGKRVIGIIALVVTGAAVVWLESAAGVIFQSALMTMQYRANPDESVILLMQMSVGVGVLSVIGISAAVIAGIQLAGTRPLPRAAAWAFAPTLVLAVILATACSLLVGFVLLTMTADHMWLYPLCSLGRGACLALFAMASIGFGIAIRVRAREAVAAGISPA